VLATEPEWASQLALVWELELVPVMGLVLAWQLAREKERELAKEMEIRWEKGLVPVTGLALVLVSELASELVSVLLSV
jgi:hypothetical protein